MEPSAFASQYPRVYHVALARNWRLIARNGLRCTTALLNAADPNQASRRASLETSRRASMAELPLADGTKAYLRDNLPIQDKQLRRLLDPGTSLQDWYRLLSARLFFWLELPAAMEFAAAYPDHEQVLLTLDTARLLAACGPRVALTRVNCGVARGGGSRGPSTFVRLEDAAPKTKYVELTVEGEVLDAAGLCVERWSLVDGKAVTRLDTGFA